MRPTPTFARPTSQELASFYQAAGHAFHEPVGPMELELSVQRFEPQRCAGFRVGERWVATVSSYDQQLTVPGGIVRVAAVNNVTVAPDFRRTGLMTRMLTDQLTDVAGEGIPVASLWASESGIYGRFGYGHAVDRLALSGPTQTMAFHPEVDLGSGWVEEVETAQLRPVAPPLRAAWSPTRPGTVDRSPAWWNIVLRDDEQSRDGAGPLRHALHRNATGDADGYATFRIARPPGDWRQLQVVEVVAHTLPGYARLWRFLLDIDLVRTFRHHQCGTDEPLVHLVADPTGLKRELLDGLFVRIVDVEQALRVRRYAVDVDVVLDVEDPLLPANTGRYRLRGGRDGADVTRVNDEPQLSMHVRTLGSAYLGGVSMATLARAGLVHTDDDACLARTSTAFGWDRAPLAADFF
ncbi:MAG: GNAT family N-acetyltransferase [Micrococcales bacterium]|nr:MAG: GNAT family N-acetyltransferase [Micrococcales bacterium]PIE27850.1 MAG: GNAT family N-acetyltransferase [Micrococcales bacterium]